MQRVGTLLALDPGYTESAWLVYDLSTGQPVRWGHEPNEHVREVVAQTPAQVLAVESVASFGMAVGADVFETCVWSGRFIERYAVEVGGEVKRVYRTDVKLHLCNARNAKDANVRQALIDRYGPSKEIAVGKKATPGPLYGLTGHCWAALGVAVTAGDQLTTALAA